MSSQVLIVMDPVASLKPAKDTSLGLAREASARGHAVFACEITDLSLREGATFVSAQKLSVQLDETPFYTLLEKESLPLSAFRWVLMRKDPPVDANFAFATHLLEHGGPECTVLNRPQALRLHNEKLAIAHFPQLCAPTLTSSNSTDLKSFVHAHGEAVLKPLDGMGGKSIFRASATDPNLSVIIETLTNGGAQLAMAQKFLPEIADGDKRILMINGEAWPRVLARIPAAGESRGNLAAGGRGEVRDISEAERAIAATVGPWLREQGVRFAGLDVIGDKLTEINVTSPTCVREIENADGSNICGAIWDAFESDPA